MTTSRALIADGRRAPRGRVEKSVTAMDGQRTAGAGSCLTQRARPAPITSRNRTKQEQERRINRKRGTACCRTLFAQDQRVTDHGRVVLITQRSWRSEEHTSELQSHSDLVCRLLLEKKKTLDILNSA